MKNHVARLYREVCARGLNTGSAGNVSARVKGGMIITPTGVRGETVAPKRLVRMGFDGEHKGEVAPSSEWRMHAAIYRGDPAANVVIHTHADAATALGALGRGLPAFHYDVALFGGDDVRLAPYALFGTAELAEHVAVAMAGRRACLLANHGMIVSGPDPDAALLAAIRLETLCRQYLLALSAGAPVVLDAAAMQAVHARYRTYGRQPDRREQ